MKRFRNATLLLWALTVVCTGFSCRSATSLKGGKQVAGKETPPAYPEATQTMKPEQCGRCHVRYYDLLKTQGGKHRIDCKECHKEFHIVRPDKEAYQDIMPKCDSCHDQVHGADLAECIGCHSEPHAPLHLPANRALEHGCYICHAETDREMKTYKTQHTEFYCYTCHHTRHRYVPACLECHQPHGSSEINTYECMVCHPPHKALQVVYPADVSGDVCALCHQHAYDTLKQSKTKHAALSCAGCHPDHRAIRGCAECHPEPHKADVLQRFPACGRCHGAAHSLLK